MALMMIKNNELKNLDSPVLQTVLNEIKVDSHIFIKNFTGTVDGITNNGYYDYKEDVSVDGYTPVGIINLNKGAHQLLVYRCAVVNTTAIIGFSSIGQGRATFTYTVLYKKNLPDGNEINAMTPSVATDKYTTEEIRSILGSSFNYIQSTTSRIQSDQWFYDYVSYDISDAPNGLYMVFLKTAEIADWGNYIIQVTSDDCFVHCDSGLVSRNGGTYSANIMGFLKKDADRVVLKVQVCLNTIAIEAGNWELKLVNIGLI